MLHLPDGAYPVLDLSARGLRIRHFKPERPSMGAHIEGTLRHPDHEEPRPLTGVIIRVQAADVAIRCSEGVLPVEWVLEELALNGTPG
jgi:hypothetical protein